MTTLEIKHKVRESLCLISTSAYLLLHTKDDDERLQHYNLLQSQIEAIITVIDENRTSPKSTA